MSESKQYGKQRVQGRHLSAIPVFTENRGLDALTYSDVIDGPSPNLVGPQAPAAQAAATRGGTAM